MAVGGKSASCREARECAGAFVSAPTGRVSAKKNPPAATLMYGDGSILGEPSRPDPRPASRAKTSRFRYTGSATQNVFRLPYEQKLVKAGNLLRQTPAYHPIPVVRRTVDFLRYYRGFLGQPSHAIRPGGYLHAPPARPAAPGGISDKLARRRIAPTSAFETWAPREAYPRHQNDRFLSSFLIGPPSRSSSGARRRKTSVRSIRSHSPLRLT